MTDMKSSVSMNCSFCLNQNIPGPHGHTIRNFNIKGSPIMCPKLLSTECRYCHEIGHTKTYCPKLKEKKSSYGNKTESTFVYNNSKKRDTAIDNDGFVCVPGNTNSYNVTNKIQKVNMLMCAFAALEVEDIDSDEICSELDKMESDGVESDGMESDAVESGGAVTYASIVSTLKTESQNMNSLVQSFQSLKDQLGIVNGTRWADADDDDL